MLFYDVSKRHQNLDEFILPRAYAQDIEEAGRHNALWHIANGFVSDAIHCILITYNDDAQKLISKAKFWLAKAMSAGEKARNFEETSNKFHRQLNAMICWLHDNDHDQADLDIWLIETQKWLANHPERLKTADLGLQAVTFINAGAYEEYISLAAPGGLDSITLSGASEKRMALTLAAAALTQKFPEDKLQKTVTKFLDNHVGTWLNNGHSVRAAEWMKVIYWKRGTTGISPTDAVHKCLDHVKLA